jgi:hypothetical protein
LLPFDSIQAVLPDVVLLSFRGPGEAGVMPFPNARADLGFFAALWPCQFPTKGNFRRRNEFIPSESVRRMNQASSVLNLERSLGRARGNHPDFQ